MRMQGFAGYTEEAHHLIDCAGTRDLPWSDGLTRGLARPAPLPQARLVGET